MATVAFTAGSWAQMAETTAVVNLQGTDYTVNKLEERQIGPGCVYTRIRVPQFPLNVNMVVVDTHNPNIRIETNLPNDQAAGTELLTAAAARHDAPNHHAITAQNGNFWIVSTQPQWDAYGASAHGVNLRNGMLAIDSKSLPPWWWWNTEANGIVGCTDTNELWIDVCKTVMTYWSEKTGTREYVCCNKGFRPGEAAIYTPWYGPDRKFLPLRDNNVNEFITVEDQECTEVLLQIADGQKWTSGSDMDFIVKEVRLSNGRGTLGNYDLAIVARRADVNLHDLAVGDNVKVNYSWVFNRNGAEVTPPVTQALGGNIMVMKDGQITEQNSWDSYNTMVYSRSAFGTSADNRYLYMLTIDKSSDPVYGQSDGCKTDVMCDLMRYLGAWNVINVDAGGSAELMVEGHIINKTTEGTPRAVGNGWIVFDESPDNDREVASIAFYDVTIKVPVLSTSYPRIIAYNKYGTVVSNDYKDVEISVDSEMGTGAGNSFIAGSQTGKCTITATGPGGCTATHEVEIVDATPTVLLKNIVIDNKHPYLMEVVSNSDGKQYTIEPWQVTWIVDNPDVADINEHGILYAKANGTTTVNAKFREMDETINVSVESTDEKAIDLANDWTGWTVKAGSGLKMGTVGTDGTFPYTYNSPRNTAQITLTGKLVLFGYPQSISMDFNSTLPVSALDLGFRSALNPRGTVTVKNAEPYAPGVMHTVDLDVAETGDADYVGTYPISLNDIRFSMPVNTAYKGAQTLKVTRLVANYNGDAGVDDIVAPAAGKLSATPTAVNAGETVTVAAPGLAAVTLYNAAGAAVATVKASGDNATVTAPAQPGVYICVATGAAGNSLGSTRLVVK